MSSRGVPKPVRPERGSRDEEGHPGTDQYRRPSLRLPSPGEHYNRAHIVVAGGTRRERDCQRAQAEKRSRDPPSIGAVSLADEQRSESDHDDTEPKKGCEPKPPVAIGLGTSSTLESRLAVIGARAKSTTSPTSSSG